MAGKRYTLSENDRDLVGRTIESVRGMGKGHIPLPKRRRGGVDGGSGGGGTVNIGIGWVASGGISAAEGWASDEWGSGDVQLQNYDGSANGDPVSVKNRYFTPFVENQPVFTYSDGTTTFVLNIGCGAGPSH